MNKFSLCVLVSMLAACSPEEQMTPAHDEVKKLFNSEAEPTSKDATWTTPKIFKVGVLDDGSSRNGYASYVCEVMYEHGFKGKGIWVQVIDIALLVRTGKWQKLGEAKCI